MSYQVFARKYRPLTFDDVLGQDHVVRTLKNAIEQKRLAHAYLFVGPRGTGKTSTARIFAKALNCPGGPKVEFDPHDPVCQEIAEGRSLDVLEIDGASNNGVEQVRDLRDNVQFAPTSGQFRIFYIDEVHMLSKAAFNALLKTLEEPPPHVKFIFATTEAHKILPTILSRCQRFDLRPIDTETIAKHLLYIASKEGVSLSQEAAFAVAKAADGGMRDAQSMLDQLVSFCGNSIEEKHVLDIFGITSRETVGQVISHLLGRQIAPLLKCMHEQADSGRDLMQFLGEMIFGLREVLVSKVDPASRMESISPALLASIEEASARLDTSKLLRVIEILAETEERMKWATNKRLHMEIGLVKAVHSLSEANISDIIRALDGAPLVEIKEIPAVPAPVAVAVAPVESQTPEPSPPPVEEKPEADTVPVAQEMPKMVREEAEEYQPSPSPEKETIPEETGMRVPVEEEKKPTPLPPVEASPAPAPAAPSAPVSVAGDFFEEISGTGSATVATPAPMSFLDNSPVRPTEQSEEEEEPLPAVDENTIPLFGELTEPPVGEKQELMVADAQLWESFLGYIKETAPFKHISIEHTPFLGMDGRKFVIGVHPGDLMARDTLLSSEMKEKINAFLLERTGQVLEIAVEASDKAPLPVEVELEPVPLPPPPPPKEKKPTPEEIKAKEQALAVERDAAKAKAMEEFYNDPLIQEALDIFQAKIAH